jgi:hypothetical protein
MVYELVGYTQTPWGVINKCLEGENPAEKSAEKGLEF